MTLRRRRRAVALLGESDESQEAAVATEDQQGGSGSAPSVVAEADGIEGNPAVHTEAGVGTGTDSIAPDERAEAAAGVEVGEGTEVSPVTELTQLSQEMGLYNPPKHPVDIPGSPRSKSKGRKKA